MAEMRLKTSSSPDPIKTKAMRKAAENAKARDKFLSGTCRDIPGREVLSTLSTISHGSRINAMSNDDRERGLALAIWLLSWRRDEMGPGLLGEFLENNITLKISGELRAWILDTLLRHDIRWLWTRALITLDTIDGIEKGNRDVTALMGWRKNLRIIWNAIYFSVDLAESWGLERRDTDALETAILDVLTGFKTMDAARVGLNPAVRDVLRLIDIRWDLTGIFARYMTGSECENLADGKREGTRHAG